MFRKPWSGPLAFIALGFLFLTIAVTITWDQASYLTEQRVRAEQSTEYHQSLAEQNINEKCLALELPALRNCIHEQIETARDHHRAEQDLDAQQMMALFTRVMGLTAIIGIFMGGVSVVLIYLTFKATQKMAVDTRDIGIAQTRAYLEVSTATLTPTDDPDVFESFLAIENVGQTPAKEVSFVQWGFFSASPDDLPWSPYVTLWSRHFTPQRSTLGPGHKIVFSDTARRTPQKSHFVFIVQISYRTIWGQRKRTLYRSYIRPDHLTGGEVKAKMYHKHNRST